MLVIHALWPPGGRLTLWGEDPAAPATAPARRGRPPKRPPARRHPFACEPWQLEEAVAEQFAVELRPREASLTLHLPSSTNAPQASPLLLRDDEPEPEPQPVTGLAPWLVPGLALASSDALDLLTSLDFPASASLRFFGEVAKLALEFVARGRLLPGLERDGERWAARWRPVPATADDDARIAHLARGIPPQCRAGTSEGWEPKAVLDHALATLVDACARDALDPDDLSPAATTTDEAWRRALAADEPWVEGDDHELELLAKALEEWTHPARAARPLRTCFRLAEPEGDGAPWRLEILLQATDDLSLIVPAGAVWHGDGLGALRRVEDPQELLLRDLGRALRLCPELAGALEAATPTEAELDTSAAHAFLTGSAGRLQRAGFGVLVPPWWRSSGARLGARLMVAAKDEARVTTKSSLGVDQLVSYRWQVALGDEEITREELEALAALKAPLVQVRGRWVELRGADLDAALRLFERGEDAGEAALADVLKTGLGLAPGPAGLPVIGFEPTGKIERLLRGDGRAAAKATPDGFNGALRPYQERGLGWLSFLESLGLGACLADDMGLGKTPTLLALLVAARGPTLVVCPMSVVGNWQREVEKFAPGLKVLVHHGSGRLAGEKFRRAATSSDLVLTTYGLAARDRDLLAKVRWRRLVLDEAQNVKNHGARQSRAVRSLPARSRIALTGTPVENRLSELWSIMDFLNPGLLGSAKSFRERFAVPIERHRDEDAAERLARLTRPFVLRRLKTDKSIIKDLPEKIEMKVFCPLTREQASLYQAVVDDMLAQIEGAEGMARKGLVLATMLRLKQVCNHPAQFLGDRSALPGRSGKLQRLEEILEEVLAEGDKALVFTQFAEFGHMLRGHLQELFGSEVPFLHGGTSKRARDAMVARFQEETGAGVLLISLKAGGVGLNLTAATHVVHFDRWWNPAVEDQATDRAFRIGQRRNVQVRKFLCAGTLEERIDEMIEGKKELAERIVGSGEAWLTELSTEELRSVVSLSSEAVVAG